MDIIKQLLGRLHPLLVHLPIGFIIFGLLFMLLDRKKKQHKKIIGTAFLWAGIIGVITCISGYLLYTSEGFKWDTIKLHLWIGIATTLFAFVMYFKLNDKPVNILKKIPTAIFSVVILILVSFTGHLGGNITHGDDYLTEPLPNGVKKALGIPTYEKQEIILDPEKWKETKVYEEVVQPIINNKCISCHGAKKAKGYLRLHNEEAILTGGENGAVFDATNPENSDFLVRLHLPKEDENHMPPKDKVQLTKGELALVEAWILEGADFKNDMAEAGLQKELLTPFFPKIETTNFPSEEVVPVDESELSRLKSKGFHAEKISKITNYLSIGCINKPNFSSSDFIELEKIKKQIAVLDFGGTKVNDSIFAQLATLPNLTILKLDNTTVTGNQIELLAQCKNLKSINLTNTQFSDAHFSALEKFPSLESVYLYNSKVDKEAVANFGNKKIKLEFGGYQIPKDSINN